jgi:hypothetical protein
VQDGYRAEEQRLQGVIKEKETTIADLEDQAFSLSLSQGGID